MPIVIVPNTKGTPVGKLADAEVHFAAGILAGTKLVGFSLWESQLPSRTGGPNIRVTYPSHKYVAADGSTKRYELLRPVGRDQRALDALRDAILKAYAEQCGGVDAATTIARETARAAQAGPHRRPQPQRATIPASPSGDAPSNPTELHADEPTRSRDQPRKTTKAALVSGRSIQPDRPQGRR